MLPNKVFFTGVPGSKWSGIAQTIESVPGFNTSDRSPTRQYVHNNFSGHVGAYFGEGMEFEPLLYAQHIESAWASPASTMLVKSHDWAYYLNEIKFKFPTDWIMLVYRSSDESMRWWLEAGGFDIKYPNYSAYEDEASMYAEIVKQNNAILDFTSSFGRGLPWEQFSPEWIEKTFGAPCAANTDFSKWSGILVTVLK